MDSELGQSCFLERAGLGGDEGWMAERQSLTTEKSPPLDPLLRGDPPAPSLTQTATLSLCTSVSLPVRERWKLRHCKEAPALTPSLQPPTSATVSRHLSACQSNIQQFQCGERAGRAGGGLRTEVAGEAAASGRLGPVKICANSRCSGSRRSELSRLQPRVCGAPKCHKGAAWATFSARKLRRGRPSVGTGGFTLGVAL